MSQSEIIDVLKKEGRPLSKSEISKLLDYSSERVVKLLTRLLKYSEINYIEIDRTIAMKKYNCKRRMRLYYVGNCSY